MADFSRNRKIVKEDIEYNRLAEDESIGEDQNHEMRGRREFLAKFCRHKSKAKYFVVLLIFLVGWLLWTSKFRRTEPRPIPQRIVWSDDMQTTIFEQSESRLEERIVHFDLKGAPPRVEYLKQLFPLLRQWGATGLLMEWEDTFPYHGKFEKVRSGYAYDDKQFREILEAARNAQLKIIPLVQTFGHMEWILKHNDFAKVREIPRYPQVICPSNNESLKLVETLIDDIVESHKGYIDTIHLGADEAYHVATECKRCRDRVEELGALDKLMLDYVSKVAQYATRKFGLRVLVWHDMFEKTDPLVLKWYQMDKWSRPVIWGYAEYLFAKDYFSDGVFERFRDTEFQKLWIASAFKGANGPDQPFVDARRYAQNHLSWLQVMDYHDKLLHNVAGIILTGWQRFDHFAILCELLPPALPSLVFNLQIVKHGGMKPELFNLTRDALSCESPDARNWTSDAPEWESIVERFRNQSHIKLKPPRPPFLETLRCNFPGSEIYALVERLRLVKQEYDTFMNHSIRRGWMHEFNLHQSYGSVHHAEITLNVTEALSHHFSLLGHALQEELAKIYYDDAVNEWLYENVQVHVDQLKHLSLGAIQIKQTVQFRNRPLTYTKLEL